MTKDNESQKIKFDWVDILERMLSTGLEAFLAMLLANATGYISIQVLKVAAIAGLMAALSVLKNSLAQYNAARKLKKIPDIVPEEWTYSDTGNDSPPENPPIPPV